MRRYGHSSRGRRCHHCSHDSAEMVALDVQRLREARTSMVLDGLDLWPGPINLVETRRARKIGSSAGKGNWLDGVSSRPGWYEEPSLLYPAVQFHALLSGPWRTHWWPRWWKQAIDSHQFWLLGLLHYWHWLVDLMPNNSAKCGRTDYRCGCGYSTCAFLHVSPPLLFPFRKRLAQVCLRVPSISSQQYTHRRRNSS